jgi:pyruvate kinase
MLSEETAIGRFPVEAVAMMGAIAADAESTFPFDAWRHRFGSGGALPEAVVRAACTVAAEIDAAAILSYTQSGATARRVAQYRPRAPIIAPTPHPETYRRLALVWGVTPLLTRSQPTTDALIDGASGTALAAAGVPRGNAVVVTVGVPVGNPAMTNSIRVETCIRRER